MPLPHFLLLLLTVITAAALTIWAAVATNVPATVMGLIVLAAAMILHFGNISGNDTHHHDER